MTSKTNALTLLLFLLPALALLAKETQKKPNILFIFTDDQSHRTVSCYPESPDWVKTPNIDSLAEKGIRFAHCYMGSWCRVHGPPCSPGIRPTGSSPCGWKGNIREVPTMQKSVLFGLPSSEKTGTRLPKLENGTPVRITDSGATGTFRKSGTVRHSLKTRATISRNNSFRQTGPSPS